MNKEELTKMNSALITDLLVSKEKEALEVKKEIEMMKGELQTRGLRVLEERNTKYMEFFGAGVGIASVSLAQKMEILNFFKLQELLGKDFVEEKIQRKPAPIKYDVDGKFGQALIALITGDYAIGYTMDEIINGITKDEKQRNLLDKKLKGDYKADKKTLCSVLKKDELELDMDTELFLIGKIKNWQLIQAFFDVGTEEKVKKLRNELKKCILVDDTIKIATKSIKGDNVA